MIELFELKNFKSIKEAELDIRPVTILIGPNGSGKSNIIQSLMLLKQSRYNNSLRINGEYRNFISIEDISFFRDITQNIEFRIHVIDKITEKKEGNDSSSNVLEYSLFNRFDERRLDSQNIMIDLDCLGTSFNFVVEDRKATHQPIYQDRKIILSSLYQIGGNVRVEFDGKFDESWRVKQQQNKLEKFLGDRLQLIGSEFDRIYFIPALRGIPFPSTPLTDSTSKEFISSETIFKQCQDLLGTLGYEPEITEKISIWAEKITGVPIKSRVIPSKQATVLSSDQIPINITHEGFGLNQLIFTLSQLYLVPEESIVTIEEPESHLHPKAQVELVEILYQNINNKKLKIIMSTHSEHVLLAFLTKVAKEELKQSDIAVYYFEKTPEGSRISQREIDNEGRIEGGMPGFFEHNLDQLQDFLNNLKKSIKAKELKG